MVDKIKGGLADNKSLQDIADKHSVTLSVIESALADGIAVEMEHTDDKEQATEIAKDHLFEDAEYYTKLKTVEKTNAIGYTKPVKIQTISVKKGEEWSKTYIAAGFIEKGVCTYNEETVYISQETLNRCIHTIKCKPNVIKHQKVTEDNVEELAVGSTTDIGIFNAETASFDVPFIIYKEEGKQKIADGWSVSCAYIPKAFGKGGTWHNTPYDREVTELKFTHLALVPDPRYEDAKIYENSKDDITTDNTTKENYNMEKIEVEQGFLASLIELAQKPFMNSKKEDKEEDKDIKDVKVDDDEMEYEGKKYSKKELVNAFLKGEAKPEVKEEKEIKNEKEAEKEEKENSVEQKDTDDDIEFFNSMQKLMAEAQSDASDKVEIPSQTKGLELGSKAFG